MIKVKNSRYSKAWRFLDERFRTLVLQRKYASLPHYRSFTLDELTAGRKPALRIRIRIDFGRLDPDPGGQKMIHKNWKKFRNFIFLFAGMFSFEG
jgi:hypothetical protein